MHHIPNQKRQQFIKQWLEYVELAQRRDNLVKKLWGMNPSLQITRELWHEAQILFLEETTVRLDPQRR